MRRHLPGLADCTHGSQADVPDGIYLVRVDRVQYGRKSQKPYYMLHLTALEPKPFAGHSLMSRIYCTQKAMGKLGWFLRDFLYDPELLRCEEIDEHALRGLVGVVKISHTTVNGIALVNFDGFAPASQWEELSTSMAGKSSEEIASPGKGVS